MGLDGDVQRVAGPGDNGRLEFLRHDWRAWHRCDAVHVFRRTGRRRLDRRRAIADALWRRGRDRPLRLARYGRWAGYVVACGGRTIRRASPYRMVQPRPD